MLTLSLSHRSPSLATTNPELAHALDALRRFLSKRTPKGKRPAGEAVALRLRLANGEIQEVELPVEVVPAFYQLLAEASRGAVAIVAMEDMLSPEEAASLLRVSRPFVMKLIQAGALPSRKVGSHYRVMAGDVLAHRERDVKARKHALRKLAELDEEIGLR